MGERGAVAGGITPPVRCVLATKLDTPPRKVFPFALRPCNSKGVVLNEGESIQDPGGGGDKLSLFSNEHLVD